MINKVTYFVVSIALTLLCAAHAQQSGVDKTFLEDCRALTAGAHRLTGSEEYRKAADYVEERLRTAGKGDKVEVIVQEFRTVRLKTKRCELVKADGNAIKLYAMRPNGITPPVTPVEGISGKLVYIGRGELSDYKTRLGDDAIVVLDYNTREAWIQAFRLGAKAVIFVRDGKLTSDSFHYTHASANLARYFFNGKVAELPLGETVTVHSSIKWESCLGRNIIGLIKGSKPTFDEQRGEESFLFAADLDSYGEVPELSKGARGAANCAGLLKIADDLIANPPRRNTVVAFFDGRWNGHMGSSAFYKWLDGRKRDELYEDTKNALEKETEYLNKILALANEENPLADTGADIRSNFLDDLKRIGANHVFEIKAKLIDMRWEKLSLERKIQKMKTELTRKEAFAEDEKDAAKRAALTKEAADFNATIDSFEAESSSRIKTLETEITELDLTKDPWNNLRRALNNEKKGKDGSITTIRQYLADNRANLESWKTEQSKLSTAAMKALEAEIATADAKIKSLSDQISRENPYIETKNEKGEMDRKPNPERKKLADERDVVKDKVKELKSKLDRTTPKAYKKLAEKVAEIEEMMQTMVRFKIAVDEEKAEKDSRLKELAKLSEFFKVTTKIYDHFKTQYLGIHVSMMFGDSSPRWGLVIGGNASFRSVMDNTGSYNRVQSGFRRAYQSLETPPKSFELKTSDVTLSPPEVVWAARKLTHSGDMAGRLAYYNLAFGTLQEKLLLEGTPDDTLENLNLSRMSGFFNEASALTLAASNSEALSLNRALKWDARYVYTKFDGKPKGTFVMAAKGSSIPNDPTPGAVVQVFYNYNTNKNTRHFSRDKIYGMNDYQVLMSDQNALITHGPGGDEISIFGMCLVFDDQGLAVQASASDNFEDSIIKRLNVRDCRPGVLPLPPLQSKTAGKIDETKIMDGNTNSPLDSTKTFGATADGFVYWYAESRTRAVKVFRTESICILKSGNPKLEPLTEEEKARLTRKERDQRIKGRGMRIEENETASVTPQSATDMWRLNNSRIETLFKRGVKDNSLAELHGRAEDLMLEAQAAETALEAESKAASSFYIQHEVYTKLRAMFDDLVMTVLVLLALCIPFAFAVERLVIGSTNIYRQILWFVGFFILTFILLFFTHPAFAISNAPLIIFLGFAILVLSGMVIWIIMRKFEVELKVLQGVESTVHAADISRFSTVVAAMNMGISSMRRRPLRTTLTAVTIILLTFTILCFASFGTQTGVIKIFSQPAPDYTGVFVRDYSWTELSDDLLTMINGRWSKETTVCRRYWLCSGSGDGQVPGILAGRADASNPLILRGVLGIDYAELKNRKALADILQADEATFDSTVWIPRSTARDLKVKKGDKILIKGEELTVGTLIDEVKLSVIRDMDDSSILPVDFQDKSSEKKESSSSGNKGGSVKQRSWKTIGVDSCAIVSNRTALRMDARLYGILLYTGDSKVASTIAEDIARIMPTPIAATLQDAVYLHILGSKLSASGVKDLFFPILLGGLVIFGTMLGSVADREKEVYTFSALGLAPPHVAGLFFAEALVYSVVGGLSGYLLAQILMKVLDFLASLGLVTVPEMNYSSTNAIITILLVMATVLISSLYPAYKASKSANPGVMRNWKVPMPEGDVLDLVFPFTVSQYDITGVVSFLREHFDAYSDTGLGMFMSRDTKLVKNQNDDLQLECKLALAPFDLGVTQYFELKSVPSEIEGIDEVAIRLTRLSGQPKDWYRLNKLLLDDLRKQFLIWRSIPHETMELYRERTLVELGEKPKPAATAENEADNS